MYDTWNTNNLSRIEIGMVRDIYGLECEALIIGVEIKMELAKIRILR